MVWYEGLDRTKPYIKDYRGWNMWYDFNNGKHHDMKRARTIWVEHWVRRFCKHEAYSRYAFTYILTPFFLYLYSQYKRFKPLPKPEESVFSGAQYVANIGRNQYGYETRATRSFEHMASVVFGAEIMTHILDIDGEKFRQEEVGDEDKGLAGDFTEEDIIQLRKVENHMPHVGIVYFRPDKHYLNEKPNDYLSPYKVKENH